ncbi:MAG: hypothetical protein SF052_25525 [Bacteroidia bacterium]|nr:hypothetical protein [Bacteroidia bacterium]
MQYINPFSLLNLDPAKFSQGLDQAKLKREKKRLLAEFELHNTPTLEIHGKQVSKSDVLRVFDMLAIDSEFAHHLRVFQNPGLLAFLEEASLDYFYSGDIALLSTLPADFLGFIGPYFAEQYNRRLFHAFRQKDWEEMKVICTHPIGIPITFFANAYKDTYRHIHTRVTEIEQLSQKIAEGEAPDGRVQEICDELLLTSINHLPDYFATVRDKYGQALEVLALAVFNTHRRGQLGMFILRQGLKLDVTTGTRDRLQYVLDQLLKLAPTESLFESFTGGGKKEEDNSTFWWIALGVGAVAAWALSKLIRD